MARSKEGWRVKWKRGIAHVRFRHEGERVERSTGERDPSRAAEAAASIYAEIVSGRGKPEHVITSTVPLVDILAEWIAALEADHEANTVKTYTLYARAHWLPFFVRFTRITRATIADYMRRRLGMVERETVKKELSTLRSFLAWCVEQGKIGEAPPVPTVPRKALGTPSAKRKKEPTDLDLAEVTGILAALPVWSSESDPDRFAVRAYFTILWETGLRPSTIAKLVEPTHYRIGATELRLTNDVDKIRFGRPVPLTRAAQEALRGVARSGQPLFGAHDYRGFLRTAAEFAKLPAEKVETITPYDLRHARALYLVEKSGDLAGAGYLLGHKHATTTDRYLRSRRRHADAVIGLVEASTPVESSGGQAGARCANDTLTEEEETMRMLCESGSVRRGGLEPPRLLGASTSTQRACSRGADFPSVGSVGARAEAHDHAHTGARPPIDRLAKTRGALALGSELWDAMDLAVMRGGA
jgi:integrase